MKRLKQTLGVAVAVALCLPALSFGALDGPMERVHAEASWMDRASKPEGSAAILAEAGFTGDRAGRGLAPAVPAVATSLRPAVNRSGSGGAKESLGAKFVKWYNYRERIRGHSPGFSVWSNAKVHHVGCDGFLSCLTSTIVTPIALPFLEAAHGAVDYFPNRSGIKAVALGLVGAVYGLVSGVLVSPLSIPNGILRMSGLSSAQVLGKEVPAAEELP